MRFDYLICPCVKAEFQNWNKQLYIIFHLFSEPEGDIGEVRESENVEKEGEDPDWIEGEGTEVSRVRLVEWRMKNESPC